MVNFFDYIPGVLLSQVPLKFLDNSNSPTTVAIIGAGAGGASTAYHLAKERLPSGVEIEVYERNDYIGGRVEHVEIDGAIVELGASIFVDVNEILSTSAEEFNLTMEPPSTNNSKNSRDDKPFGMWNGEEIAFELEWADAFYQNYAIQIARKFGVLSPYRALQLKKSAVSKFVESYKEPYFPWKNLEALIDQIGLREYVNITAGDWLEDHSVSQEYRDLFLQGLTRVNYGNNLDNTHALAAAVCMAAQDGTHSIKGGNNQIFQEMIKRSGAKTWLSHDIRGIKYIEGKNQWLVDGKPFEYVVIAAPLKYTGLKIDPEPDRALVPNVDYVKLHVHYVLVDEPMTGEYMGTNSSYATVLTTAIPPFAPPLFTSLSHVTETDNGNHLYKVFTRGQLNDGQLSDLLGRPILQNFHRVWYSYPEMKPFDELAPIALAQNLFYTGGMDPLISTMETNALAGKNVARLISDMVVSQERQNEL